MLIWLSAQNRAQKPMSTSDQHLKLYGSSKYCILQKNKPPVLFDLQVLAPLPYKYCTIIKKERAKIDKDVVFVVWTVCLPHLSALSVTYGKSMENKLKKFIDGGNVRGSGVPIGLGYDRGQLAT